MIAKQELLLDAAARLAAAGIDSARTDARLLLCHVLGLTAAEILGVDRIDTADADTFERLVQRRLAREPLAYITGTKEFFSLDFEVGPGVLIPRPETETLVEEALKDFADCAAALRVLDYGTGSGCLIISFLVHYPRSTGLGIDISDRALSWAKRNARRHGLTDRLSLAMDTSKTVGAFDLIFANPPYLTETEFGESAAEILHHEPKAAFVGGDDGLASYRALAVRIPEMLAPRGRAYIEIGAGQAPQVAGLFRAEGLEVHRFVPDLQGMLRCAVVGRQDGRDPAPQKTVGKQPATR